MKNRNTHKQKDLFVYTFMPSFLFVFLFLTGGYSFIDF